VHIDWQFQRIRQLDLLLEHFALNFPQPLLLFTVNFANHMWAEVQPNFSYCYQLRGMLPYEV
jgi:hypothetical protein